MRNKRDVDKNLLIKQYEISVEMADRVSQRRAEANKFYCALIGSLLTITIAIFKDKILLEKYYLIIFLIGFLGIVICIIWILNIKSYKTLNSAKYKIITEIEEHLFYPVFKKEWEILDNGKNPQKHLTLSAIEQIIPFIMSFPFCLMAIVPLWNFFIKHISIIVKPYLSMY